MARPGVTREQIFTVADALAEEGIQPTVKVVRDRIGGSYTTITPHLAAWKDERSGRGVANIPDMPETVLSAARTIWATAWNAGQAVIKTERDGLAAARRELDEERSELGEEIAALETKLETTAGERDALRQSLKDEETRHRQVKDEAGELRIENARLTERIANTQARAEELREQVARLEAELSKLAHTKRAAKGEG